MADAWLYPYTDFGEGRDFLPMPMPMPMPMPVLRAVVPVGPHGRGLTLAGRPYPNTTRRHRRRGSLTHPLGVGFRTANAGKTDRRALNRRPDSSCGCRCRRPASPATTATATTAHEVHLPAAEQVVATNELRSAVIALTGAPVGAPKLANPMWSRLRLGAARIRR